MSLPLVHTKQTSDGFQRSTSYRAQKSLKCENEIAKIREIFTILERSEDSPVLKRFDTCHTGAWFERNKQTHKVRIRSKKCFIRWCPLCGNSRQIFVAGQVKGWLEKQRFPKLLTLTIAHQDVPLSEQITHLYKSFQMLRKKVVIRKAVTGMVWFFQIKRSKIDKKWHPHIHAVLTGKYIPHEKLAKAWKAVTGDSEIVHIKPIDNVQRSCDHVARYATSPGDLNVLDIADGCEVVSALKGKRILGTTGTARKISFKPKRVSEPKEWESIGSYSYVKQLLDSDDRAVAIMEAYLLDGPLDDGNSLRDLEREVFEDYLEHERPPPKVNTTWFPEF